MPSSRLSAALAAARAALFVAGVGVAAATVYKLATMPPPPPGGDGFAHGMAAIFGGLILVASLGVAAVSVVLPAALGFDDPLGFGRHQRLALKAAGTLVGGGVVLGPASAFLGRLSDGLVLTVLLVTLGAVVVGATLVWRLAEVLVDRLSRVGGEGTR